MSAVDAPERTQKVGRAEDRSRALAIAIAVLGVVAVILGGWLAYELLATDEAAVPAEVQAAIDGYTAAWNTYDTAALQDHVTADYRFYDTPVGPVDATPPGQPGATVDEVATMITDSWATNELTVEPVGPHRMAADGRVVYVTGIERLNGPGIDETAISVYHLVTDGDTWRIQAHEVLR